MGRPGIESLNLIAIINLLEDKYIAMYPNLFKGLGTINGEYHISLRGAKPFALSTPRRVALPLMPKSWIGWRQCESSPELTTNGLVHWNSSRTEAEWKPSNMCRSNQTQQKC